MEIPDDFQASTDAFLRWFESQPNAQINSKVTLADLRAKNEGRGLVAQEDITEDEVLFTIPRQSILNVRNSDLRTKAPNILADLDSWQSLILVMIYEHLQGPSSPWKEYLDVLMAAQLDALMFWSTDQLAELQGSAVVHKIGRAEADQSFREHLLPRIMAHPQLFPLSHDRGLDGSDDDVANSILAKAHCMGSIILAYAFDIEEDEEDDESAHDTDNDAEELVEDDEEAVIFPKGLVPMADMLNADADMKNARLFQGESSLTMNTLKAITKGEQIYNDYGPLPRSDLLRRYGYVTDAYAQYDVVELATAIVVQVISTQIGLEAEDLRARVSIFP
ncbi:MAG: hypothetical protein M1838_005245 [Thelocarpon superellum]|nr:MAG: hypothetical protein M1838_005245 [Thelocarpon superellum]